jgi:hypothetical protein
LEGDCAVDLHSFYSSLCVDVKQAGRWPGSAKIMTGGNCSTIKPMKEALAMKLFDKGETNVSN